MYACAEHLIVQLINSSTYLSWIYSPSSFSCFEDASSTSFLNFSTRRKKRQRTCFAYHISKLTIVTIIHTFTNFLQEINISSPFLKRITHVGDLTSHRRQTLLSIATFLLSSFSNGSTLFQCLFNVCSIHLVSHSF